MKQTKFAKSLALSVGVLVFSGAISYLIFAWTAPSSTPPEDNVAAPINTGPTAQGKMGNLGIGTTNPTAQLDVVGQVKISGGSPATGKVLTSDANGLATWQTPSGGVVARDCGENGWMQGINPDGTIICGSSGTPPMPANCNEALSGGNKKIFVTSLTYAGTSLTSDNAADALCQARANAAGHKDINGNNAIFKALVYLGGRTPISIMAGANYYWNGVISGTRCDWKLVANSGSDFFTDKSGSWLRAPITGNESGGAMNVNVWTNIRPTGGGNYSLLNTANINTNPCASSPRVWGQNLGCCYPCCYVSWLYISGIDTLRCYRSQHWYGNSSSANLSWAYNLYASGTDACNTCKSQSRALYCVEQ